MAQQKIPCNICGTTGKVKDLDNPIKDGNYIRYNDKSCPTCDGHGYTWKPTISNNSPNKEVGCLMNLLILFSMCLLINYFLL